jgi:hypothetical protein
VKLPIDFSNDANLEFNIDYLNDHNNEKQNCKSKKIFQCKVDVENFQPLNSNFIHFNNVFDTTSLHVHSSKKIKPTGTQHFLYHKLET